MGFGPKNEAEQHGESAFVNRRICTSGSLWCSTFYDPLGADAASHLHSFPHLARPEPVFVPWQPSQCQIVAQAHHSSTQQLAARACQPLERLATGLQEFEHEACGM